MNGTCSISGQLLMPDGVTPHVAVAVQVLRQHSVNRTVLTDASGRYQCLGLEPGEYQVRCYTTKGYTYLSPQACEPPSIDGNVVVLTQGSSATGLDLCLPSFKRGNWHSYHYLDGLPDDKVLAIHEDDDGILWFGTWVGGIARYDGVEFVNLTTGDGLADNNVQAIHGDSEGVLWFGTGRGVSRYDGNEFINLTTEHGLVHDSVRAIHQDTDGILWFGTEGGLSRYDGNEFTNLTTEHGLVHDSVWAIHQDTDGILWFGTEGGLSRYDGNGFSNLTTEHGLLSNHVIALAQTSDGGLWIGTLRGVSRYDGHDFMHLTMEQGLPHNCGLSLYPSPDGRLWIGTDQGVSCYDGQCVTNFTEDDGLADSVGIRAIHRASDSTMWFGTFGGLSRYEAEGAIANFTTRDGLPENNICAFHRHSDGNLWLATWGTGLVRYDGQEFTKFATNDRTLDSVTVFFEDASGILWLGTTRGLLRSDGTRLTRFTTEDGLANNLVHAICQDDDGLLWISTRDGISVYDGRHFTTYTTDEGLTRNLARVFCRDGQGRLWIGTWGGGICCYDGQRFLTYTTKDGLPHDVVHALCVDREDRLWIGTWGGGISCYDGEKFVNFGPEDGVAHPSVNAAYCAVDGTLWFATDGGGVCHYDGTTWTSLDTRDGLAGNFVRCLFEDKDGSFWFGTATGVTHYYPASSPPAVRVLSVRADREYTQVDTIPSLVAGNRATITYRAVGSQTPPEKQQYRVRIRETDLDWRHTTGETAFDHTFRQPGIHTVEIQAIDRDLNYSEPAVVRLTVELDPQVASLQAEVSELQREVRRQYRFENIIGKSAPIRRVYELMEKAAQCDLTVIIDGETGAGKEGVAMGIHYNSARSHRKPISYDCGRLTEDLAASELFGYRKGAFTGAYEDKMGLFESAHGSTLILDEVGNMSLEVQRKLLRVLEERQVQRLGELTTVRDIDVRVIVITNLDLQAEVNAGRFREDLYYRLNEFSITVPPLRDRREDIPLLADHFIRATGKELEGFASDVLQVLQSHSWPGNVRELQNEVRRACAFADEGTTVRLYHFSPHLTQGEAAIQEALNASSGLSDAVAMFQRRLVEQALEVCDGNRHEAARRLKMHRPNLLRLMKRLGIQ